MRLIAATVLLMVVAAAAAPAADTQAGTLIISRPWSRPTPPVASTGVVYLSITNRGPKADRLLAATTPVARSAEFHESRTLDGMVQMRRLAALDCPARSTVAIEPGGLHIMLVGLTRPLAAGTDFPLTLRFREAGEVTIQVHVGEGE